ncbi:MAG: SufS family cysteine desulfurase [Bacteroidales bacterium]|nr:SufS family cysteine desulfurase [Bacteroidales bacterium]
MTVTEIRSEFPILSSKVYSRPLVYLDNAASSQRPLSVVRKLDEMSLEANANIHRAVHALSARATDEFEAARDAVREALNAEHREEIIFTSGATASINLLAFSFGEAFVGEGDEVIVSRAEHHSNIVPWQLLCQRKKASLKVLEIDENGELSVEGLEKLISQKTKIIAISQISNVLGCANPIREIVETAHKYGIPVLVDGAQGFVHLQTDVQELGCDFYVFSGHKVFAATGTGVLYGKKEWLDKLPPYMGGGEMIATVSFDETTFAPLPHKFEAGTQNFNAVPTLIPALELRNVCLSDPLLLQNMEEMKAYVLDALLSDPRITLYGVPRRTIDKIPLFSFTVKGVHHEDLALIMDKMGIALRSGQMCAEPLMDYFGVSGMLRASFAPYNTMDEARYFIESLDKAIKMLI